MGKLESVIESKSTLISIIAHDINNPLTFGIAAPICLEQILQKYTQHFSKDDQILIERNLELMNRSNNTIKVIIKDTLELEALNLGLANIKLAPTSLTDVTNEVFKTFEERLKEKSLKLNISINSDSDLINVHKSTFTNSVMNNFISNAIKFSFEGGTIFIRAHRENSTVKVSIRDEGIGMEKEMQRNIFSIIGKQSRVGTSGEVGTGFGLPIVKNFLQKYGATIEVSSKTKKDVVEDETTGTEFIISFPAID